KNVHSERHSRGERMDPSCRVLTCGAHVELRLNTWFSVFAAAVPAMATMAAMSAATAVVPAPASASTSTTTAAAARTAVSVAFPLLPAPGRDALRCVVAVEVRFIRFFFEFAATFDRHRSRRHGLGRSFTAAHLRALLFQNGFAR